MDTSRTAALMDGPEPRTPERVTEGMVLRGHRVIIADHRGEFVRDLRAADDPYWYDEQAESPAHARWRTGQAPPAGADPLRARLFVAVCTEQDWYSWAQTRRRPEIREYPAYLVWAE